MKFVELTSADSMYGATTTRVWVNLELCNYMRRHQYSTGGKVTRLFFGSVSQDAEGNTDTQTVDILETPEQVLRIAKT